MEVCIQIKLSLKEFFYKILINFIRFLLKGHQNLCIADRAVMSSSVLQTESSRLQELFVLFSHKGCDDNCERFVFSIKTSILNPH